MTSSYSDEWVRMLSEGVASFTIPDLQARSGVTANAAKIAVMRGQDKGWLFSPVRGLYVIVPPEYHSWGVVPGERFVDAAMAQSKADYYVGYLSAAAHHGARHQAGQVFQVVTDRRIKDRDINGLSIRYYLTNDIRKDDVEIVRAEYGRWRVSTAEATLLDLLERPDRGGGLDNALTIAAELPLDATRLADAAMRRGTAAARRAGWALSRAGAKVDLGRLRPLANVGAGPATPADPRNPPGGTLDREWWILANTLAEPDR